MIAQKHRFHRRNHVRYVYEHGRSVRGDAISLKIVRGQEHEDYRAAVVVSRKVSKSAVKRNRIRRRLFELVRTIGLPQDVDVVITVFSDEVASMKAAELEDTMRELFRKALDA